MGAAYLVQFGYCPLDFAILQVGKNRCPGFHHRLVIRRTHYEQAPILAADIVLQPVSGR